MLLCSFSPDNSSKHTSTVFMLKKTNSSLDAIFFKKEKKRQHFLPQSLKYTPGKVLKCISVVFFSARFSLCRIMNVPYWCAAKIASLVQCLGVNLMLQTSKFLKLLLLWRCSHLFFKVIKEPTSSYSHHLAATLPSELLINNLQQQHSCSSGVHTLPPHVCSAFVGNVLAMCNVLFFIWGWILLSRDQMTLKPQNWQRVMMMVSGQLRKWAWSNQKVSCSSLELFRVRNQISNQLN